MDKDYMLNVIDEYLMSCPEGLNEKECEKCDEDQIECCCHIAENICNSAFAESIDYGGCDSEEEFWEELFS